MARMIPPIPDDKVSNAEKKVFKWLSQYKDDSVIVLHSLFLPDHNYKQIGEIDFVLICREGILCIEVKGGRVSRENGCWIFQDRYGDKNTKSEGPFKQAQGNALSLQKKLEREQKNHDWKHRLFASCVIMPDCTIDHNTEEVIPEILFDINNQRDDLDSFLKRVFQYWRSRIKYDPIGLSDEYINNAVEYLRKDFAFEPRISVIINGIDGQFVELTEQQNAVIEGLEENERICVQGSAGTGKTLLALEQANRLADKGKKVLYLCKNKALAGYLREKNSNKRDKFDIYNIEGYLVKVCGEPKPGFLGSLTDAFREMPPKFVDMMKSEQNTEKYTYDAVIIDEGQDLINLDYYDCINSMIRGGFKDGIWTVYFDRLQNILNRDKREKYEEYDLLDDEGHPAKYVLKINCRNTKQVMEANYLHTGKEQGKTKITDGLDPEYFCFKDLCEEKNMVFKTIRKLLSEGTKRKDIALLSKYRIDTPKSCLCGAETEFAKEFGEIRFNPNKDFEKDCISYYTIQSFKGLESKVILLLDVDGFQSEKDRRLNYVAMSRAKALLYVFYPEDKENERLRVITENSEIKK